MKKAEAKQRVQQEGGWEIVKVFETYHLIAWFGWSEGYVKKMRDAGCPSWKEGGRNRYDQKEVQTWLEKQYFFVPSDESIEYCNNNDIGVLIV